MDISKLFENIVEQTPRRSARIRNKNSVARDNVSISSVETQRSNGYRMPTPYKQKDIRVSLDFGEDVNETTVFPTELFTVPETAEKDMSHGMRRRSRSFCCDKKSLLIGPKSVTFYSPANHTVVIEDFDDKDIESASKPKPKLNNVTLRRKRSISLEGLKCEDIKLKQISASAGTTPLKLSVSKQVQRTKLPNFAAIHEKNFRKMENLVEHVARKAERAKVLTSSALKSHTGSTKKKVENPSQITATGHEKPKAVKNLGLTETSFAVSVQQKEKERKRKIQEDHDKPVKVAKQSHLFDLPSGIVPLDSDGSKSDSIPVLPRPKFPTPTTESVDIKPFTKGEFGNTSNVLPEKAPKSKLTSGIPVKSRAGPVQKEVGKAKEFSFTANVKKTASKHELGNATFVPSERAQSSNKLFNTTHFGSLAPTADALKTLGKGNEFSFASALTLQKFPAALPALPTPRLPAATGSRLGNLKCTTARRLEEKSVSREKRHMNLYKARTNTRAKRTIDTNEIIRGVRSNRRFDLQMQHRKNLELQQSKI